MSTVELKAAIEKHLHFHGKTNDKWWLQASVKHYLDSGSVSGSFFEAIEKIVAAKDQQIQELEKENQKLKSDLIATEKDRMEKVDQIIEKQEQLNEFLNADEEYADETITSLKWKITSLEKELKEKEVQISNLEILRSSDKPYIELLKEANDNLQSQLTKCQEERKEIAKSSFAAGCTIHNRTNNMEDFIKQQQQYLSQFDQPKK